MRINAVAHQNGTVRFGTDPATSALDLDCKMHDLDNFLVPVFSGSCAGTSPTRPPCLLRRRPYQNRI